MKGQAETVHLLTSNPTLMHYFDNEELKVLAAFSEIKLLHHEFVLPLSENQLIILISPETLFPSKQVSQRQTVLGLWYGSKNVEGITAKGKDALLISFNEGQLQTLLKSYFYILFKLNQMLSTRLTHLLYQTGLG